MASCTELIEIVDKQQFASVPKCRRWTRSAVEKRAAAAALPSDRIDSQSEAIAWTNTASLRNSVPPPPTPSVDVRQRPSKKTSYILQHYDATGCAGGAFSWRAAMLNPQKKLFMCIEPREYRATNIQDIRISKEDKRRGGGPRVGPFQECIPGGGWQALPKYDFTTRNRSSAFNERMHVEWENHVDHILKNDGELPTASVVAKAGFRSCAPCCRDMLALARPTGKTFIMVDLAEDDQRGTFHFVAGDQYLPVPKEACTDAEVRALKNIVMDAQNNCYGSSKAICDAVLELGVPVDETAQAMYLGDRALLPLGCAAHVKGEALVEVLHAEHFARLAAEYGASILRDAQRPEVQRNAVHECRSRAQGMLTAAWRRACVRGVDLVAYAAAATAPLLPEHPSTYLQLKRTIRRGLWSTQSPRLTAEKLQAIDECTEPTRAAPLPGNLGFASLPRKAKVDTDSPSDASTEVPEDCVSTVQGDDACEQCGEEI